MSQIANHQHPRAVFGRLPGTDGAFTLNPALAGLGIINAGDLANIRSDRIIIGGNTQFPTVAVPVVDGSPTTNGGGGGIQLGNFPRGNILWSAAAASIQVVSVSGGVTATAASVVFGLGIAQADNSATLSANEVRLGNGTFPTLVGGAANLNIVAAPTNPSTVGLLNGETTPIGLWLNIGVPDADIDGAGALNIRGYVDIFWKHVTNFSNINSNGFPSWG